jgi:hypothetical protein
VGDVVGGLGADTSVDMTEGDGVGGDTSVALGDAVPMGKGASVIGMDKLRLKACGLDAARSKLYPNMESNKLYTQAKVEGGM